MHFLAHEAGNSIVVSGQYGFLRQHDILTSISQWGFDSASLAWHSDTEPFSSVNFDTFLLTTGNFILDQSSSSPYYDDPNPTNTTLNIQNHSDLECTEMFDIKGRLVLVKNGVIPESSDISFLSKGAYMLNLKCYDKAVLAKIVVKN